LILKRIQNGSEYYFIPSKMRKIPSFHTRK
jgi:hypothetical protein